MSQMSGSWTECCFANIADYTAYASSSTEGSLLAGGSADLPAFPPLFFHGKAGRGRAIRIKARGVFSTTATPTLIFQARLGATSGSSYLSGTSVGISAAITTASGVTSKYWELNLDLICTIPGVGTNACTVAGAGTVMSPSGFGTPFIYPLEPTTPDTATWTGTIDSAVQQYLNLSATWSANSASNTITLKQLIVLGLN